MPTVRVYTTEEKATGAVPELRRSHQPVPKWLRVVAIVVGTAVGGAVGSTTSGAVIASRLGLVTQKSHEEDREADKRERTARDAVVDGKFADIGKRLDDMTKGQTAQAQAMQQVSRALKKLRPAPKDLP